MNYIAFVLIALPATIFALSALFLIQSIDNNQEQKPKRERGFTIIYSSKARRRKAFKNFISPGLLPRVKQVVDNNRDEFLKNKAAEYLFEALKAHYMSVPFVRLVNGTPYWNAARRINKLRKKLNHKKQ